VTLPSLSTPSQQWSAATYAANGHFVPALGQPVLDLLNAQPSERILDLGCGDGVLTEKLVVLGRRGLASIILRTWSLPLVSAALMWNWVRGVPFVRDHNTSKIP
jgi:trans-aconitate methyltransferase